ncbi:MAG: TatD family hydrolase [Bacteroidales bacterium]|nr:TatD family hydrolase [Bacteroidales bacterium]
MVIDFHTHRDVPKGVFSPRSFGVHPWQAGQQEVPEAEDARWHEVLMVGECGLDAVRGPSMEVQTACFEQQLDVAERLGKPVVVHCVRAFDRLMALRRRFGGTPWVVHGFVGHAQQAHQLVKMGIWPSIGAALLDPRRGKVADTVGWLGPDRLLLETDDSGADIHDVYEAACRLLDVSMDELERSVETHLKAHVLLSQHPIP